MKRIPLFLLIFSFFFVGAVNAITVENGVIMIAETGGGNVTTAGNYTVESLQFAADQVRFTEYSYTGGSVWDYLGFGVNKNTAVMNLTALTDSLMVLTCNASENTEFEVWLPYMAPPNNVTGVASWDYSAPTLSYSLSADSEITITWSASQIQGGTLTGWFFADTVESDFIGGFVGSATNAIGSLFWAFIGIILVIPVAIRVGAIPAAIIGLMIILGGVFTNVLPAPAYNLAIAIIMLAIASIIAVLLFSRRRQYG
jgi:hypothetical protein